MIWEILKDIRYFGLVLILTCFSFANAFYILEAFWDDDDHASHYSSYQLFLSFIYTYKLSLGDATIKHNSEFVKLTHVIWILATIITQVLLFNMIISLMGDTFDRVQETAPQRIMQDHTRMVIENENWFVYNRRELFRRKKFLILVSPERGERI